jgi:crotonobetainyl-CoA:carnitine CoA-transferase CaiB-like acyl-CoA transferase
MAKTRDVPKFGLLSGLKVFSTGSVIAAPYAASLFAENGATVIHAESTVAPDSCRSIKYAWNQEHRNELGMALNIPSPQGKKIFFKLCAWADIWIESSKGGSYASLGLTDEVIWEHNPRLVIVHVSGFGQEGDPDYTCREGYDAIGQAFGGAMAINGMPEPEPPLRSRPYTADYVTALHAAWAGLAATMRAQATGRGESIDLAQFELMTRIQSQYPMAYFQDNQLPKRSGNADPKYAGHSAFKCQDGNYVFIILAGASHLQRALPILGLADDPAFPTSTQVVLKATPAGEKLNRAIQAFCDERTAEEVEGICTQNEIPCSRVYDLPLAEQNSHYQARKVFTEWEDPQYGRVKGVGPLPHAKNNPPKIWRGAPLYGQDNDDLMREFFDYNDDQIEELYEKGVLKAGKGCH